MEDLGLKNEVEWLWIEDRQSRFEDIIMPNQHLIHILLFVKLFLGHCTILKFPLEDD